MKNIDNKELNQVKKESKQILAQIMSTEKVRREVGEKYKKID